MTPTTAKRPGDRIVLRRVPYKLYVQLRRDPVNRHVRMTYYDGTLEFMSPTLFEHEQWSLRLFMVVLAVTCELRIPCVHSGSTTFRRAGGAVRKGKGKEPDQSFYLAHAAEIRGKKTVDLDAGDPPPDLWIEVDHRASSRGRLPVYAALEVPEVWRYRSRRKTLTFLGLDREGHYEPIAHSLSLPMLAPEAVQQALGLIDGLTDSEWNYRLWEWVRDTFGQGRA